jgi:hypothetical protein
MKKILITIMIFAMLTTIVSAVECDGVGFTNLDNCTIDANYIEILSDQSFNDVNINIINGGWMDIYGNVTGEIHASGSDSGFSIYEDSSQSEPTAYTNVDYYIESDDVWFDLEGVNSNINVINPSGYNVGVWFGDSIYRECSVKIDSVPLSSGNYDLDGSPLYCGYDSPSFGNATYTFSVDTNTNPEFIGKTANLYLKLSDVAGIDDTTIWNVYNDGVLKTEGVDFTILQDVPTQYAVTVPGFSEWIFSTEELDFNNAPIIDSFTSVGPTSSHDPETIFFSVVANDPEEDPLTYEWYLNDTLQVGEETATYSVDVTEDTTLEVYVVVSDGELNDTSNTIVFNFDLLGYEPTYTEDNIGTVVIDTGAKMILGIPAKILGMILGLALAAAVLFGIRVWSKKK